MDTPPRTKLRLVRAMRKAEEKQSEQVVNAIVVATFILSCVGLTLSAILVRSCDNVRTIANETTKIFGDGGDALTPHVAGTAGDSSDEDGSAGRGADLDGAARQASGTNQD